MNTRNVLAIVILCFMGMNMFVSLQYLGTAETIELESSKIMENFSNAMNITIIQNLTSLGRSSTIGFNVSLHNQGTNKMENIGVNLNTTSDNIDVSYGKFISTELEINSSTSFEATIQVINASKLNPKPVDLLLCVDASGSMGEEIAAVQQKLTELINTFNVEIPDLRIGVIVYGWSKYSEYPMSSDNNYIDLTDDFEKVKNYINQLSASGGTEPWGDALYLANTFSWRLESNKLIVLIGDEDCDPGHIIGRDTTTSCYNGSELVSIVSQLNEKGISINTVVTDNPDYNVVNQFSWIATTTGGNSVFLPDLKQAADPKSLPDLIEEWTIEKSREYSHWFFVNVKWIEDDTEYTNSAKKHFWFDVAPPSIIYSSSMKITSKHEYILQISAEVKDISPIQEVVIYHNGPNMWVAEEMQYSNESQVWQISLTAVELYQNISFFIEASDVLSNANSTKDDWIIIQPLQRHLYENNVISLQNGETEVTVFEPEHEGTYYLWLNIKSDRDRPNTFKLYNILNENQVIQTKSYGIESVKTKNKTTILEFELEKAKYHLSIREDNKSRYNAIEYSWLDVIHVSNTIEYSDILTDKTRRRLIYWENPSSEYLSIGYTPQSDLVAVGDVYLPNWAYLGNITVQNYVNLTEKSPGACFIVIHGVLRTGSYQVVIRSSPPNVDDPYYTEAALMAQGANFDFYMIIPGLLAVTILLQRKKRRRE